MEKIVLIFSFLVGIIFSSILIFFKKRIIKRQSYREYIKELILFIIHLKQEELLITKQGFKFSKPIPFLQSLSGVRYFSFQSIINVNYKDRFFCKKLKKESSLQELLGNGVLSSSHYLNKEDILSKLYEIYYKYGGERF